MDLFKPFRNRNFVALFFFNFFTVAYVYLATAYFAYRKDFRIADAALGFDSVTIVLVAMTVTLVLSLALFVVSLSRVRSWIVFLIHAIVVVIAVVFISAPNFDPGNNNVLIGSLFGGFFYFLFFGPSTWFLFRFRSTLVPVIAYSFFFIGAALLANDKYKDNDLLHLLRPDILFIVVVFFLLISLILYFENLLKFARELNKPAVPIKKGFYGMAIVGILVVIPTILGLFIGVQRAKFHQRRLDEEKLAEELKKKELELKRKEQRLKGQDDSPSEGEKLEDPYGNPFDISSSNNVLFEVTMSKGYDKDLVLRAVSYSLWNDEKTEFVVDNTGSKTYLSDNKVFTLPTLDSKNRVEEFTSTYQFTEAFNYKVVPHLLTAIECSESVLFYTQKDFLLSDVEIADVRDLEIKSSSLVDDQNFTYDITKKTEQNLQDYLSVPNDEQLKSFIRNNNIYKEDRSDTNAYKNKINSIYNYIVSNYEYDPQTDEASTKKILNYKEFLFTEKVGNSLNFAEAFTLLLRTENIPSRVVTGYVAKNEGFGQRVFKLSEADKLFWVEVYFPNAGWINYFPIGSEVERQALEEKSQQKQEDEKFDSEPEYYYDENGKPFKPLTEEEIEKLNEKEKKEYEDLLKQKEELEKQQEEQKEKNKQDLSWIGRIIKIFVIIIFIFLTILVFAYLVIYPAIRFFLIKNKLNKINEPYQKIITSYKQIVSIYKWFGLKVNKSTPPTEVIKNIEDKFKVNMYDIGWIYNRAVLREKLQEKDVEKAISAFDEAWYDRFDKNFGFRSMMYFYRVGKNR